MTKNTSTIILGCRTKEWIMKKDESMDIYFYITGWIGIAIVSIIVIIIHIYGTGILAKVPSCSFRRMSGYYCPGCGGTRAAFAFARGQFIRSFKFHPIVLYTMVVGGWFMLSQTIQRLSKNRIKIALHFRPIYAWIAIALILLNCIIKNAVLIFTGVALLG